MLNRRILRIKVFKELYAYAENPGMTLKEALRELETACEATRDLYLLMLAVVPPLTAEAGKRLEAAGRKFRKTEEDLHPNRKFADNRLAPLLAGDADLQKLLSRKKLSWEPYDAFVRDLFDAVAGEEWYRAYMASPEASIAEDVRLFVRIYEEELVESKALADILEDLSVYWNDDLAYALTWCCRSLGEIGRTGRWSLPPLYQSDILRRAGKDVQSDHDFASKLLQCAFGQFQEYYRRVAEAAMKWDRDRLFVTDLVLIAQGLAEAEHFPDIPARVTINEYVEISKYYSTPKSSSFVNGLLDRLIVNK